LQELAVLSISSAVAESASACNTAAWPPVRLSACFWASYKDEVDVLMTLLDRLTLEFGE
jgi:hypothetical protein